MMKPPSTSSAVVSIPAGSEPWLGSVSPYDTQQFSLENDRKEMNDRSTHKCSDEFTLGQSGQELLLLCLCSKLVDGMHDQRRLHRSSRSIARVHSTRTNNVSGRRDLESPRAWTMEPYLSISRAIRPYATLLAPAQPYPSMVGPRSPSLPISGRMSWSNSTKICW